MQHVALLLLLPLLLLLLPCSYLLHQSPPLGLPLLGAVLLPAKHARYYNRPVAAGRVRGNMPMQQ